MNAGLPVLLCIIAALSDASRLRPPAPASAPRSRAASGLKTGYVSDIYTVLKIDGDTVLCDRRETHEQKTFQMSDIVAVAEFGEPIYPTLKPLDFVENAPGSDLWHTLIEADNYHALQLLEYLYAEKVDCIYIDPPYNTGAKDWKFMMVCFLSKN